MSNVITRSKCDSMRVSSAKSRNDQMASCRSANMFEFQQGVGGDFSPSINTYSESQPSRPSSETSEVCPASSYMVLTQLHTVINDSQRVTAGLHCDPLGRLVWMLKWKVDGCKSFCIVLLTLR